MINTIEQDFLSVLSEIHPVIINERIWLELMAYYPNKYKGLDYATKRIDEMTLSQASFDYFNIIKSYLRVEKIPVLMETLVAGYLWGVDNLKEKGLSKAPDEVKTIIGKMKHELQPQSEQLENKEKYI